MGGVSKSANPFDTPPNPLDLENSIHLHPYPLRVARKLRRIHTLHRRNPVAHVTAERHHERVLEHEGASGEIVNEEVRGQILSALVVAQPSLPTIAAEHINRLQAGSTHIFEV